MMRAYKFRIYPTDEQQRELTKYFGASRYVWNWALKLIKDNFNHTEMIRYSWNGDLNTYNYEDTLTMKFHGCKDTSITPYRIDVTKCSALLTSAVKRKTIGLPDGIKHEIGLKDQCNWLCEVPDKILRSSLRNLGTAFKNFFKSNKSGDHVGYPKPKTLKNNQSIQFQSENIKLDIKTGMISIPKMKGIEVRLHRPIDGKIKTTTISKTKSGKYYVSFQVDNEIDLPITKHVSRDKIVGIDVGLLSYITTSDGKKLMEFNHLENLRNV